MNTKFGILIYAGLVLIANLAMMSLAKLTVSEAVAIFLANIALFLLCILLYRRFTDR